MPGKFTFLHVILMLRSVASYTAPCSFTAYYKTVIKVTVIQTS